MAEQQKKAQQAQEPDLNQLRKVRREKLAELQSAGKDPFITTKYDVTHHSLEIKDNFEAIIDSMAPSSIIVRLIAYTPATAGSEVRRVKSDVIREIIHRYRAEGIEFAFPSTSVYMAK